MDIDKAKIKREVIFFWDDYKVAMLASCVAFVAGALIF